MDQRTTLIIGGAIAGFIAYSFIVAFIFQFMAGLPQIPMPWYPWVLLYQAAFMDMPLGKAGSQLFVAFGVPIFALFVCGGRLYELLKNNENDFADSSWATKHELRKAGLMNNQGIFLGKIGNQYISSDNDSHTIVAARTRTGKGVGLIIPNLLLWNGSVVCLDIKHENFNLTGQYRSEHSSGRVYKWDPLADDMRSHGFNPLDQISKDPMNRITDIRMIAGILMPIEGRDIFWITEARSLFVGLALYVLDQPDEIMPSTIGSIYRLLSAEAELGDICRLVVKKHPELNQAIVATMNRFANKAAKERSGVKSQLDSALEPWKDAKIDAATSKSSFQLKELRKNKMSIYICVKPGQINQLSGIIRIFFEFLINNITMDIPNKEQEPHDVLVVLDEMHMLGKMETIENAFTLSAGYGCRVLAAIQDFSVLDRVYGKEGRKAIFSNCENQIFFRPRVLDTAKEISSMLGTRLVETTSYSQKSSFNYEPQTKTTTQQEKPLMSAAKIMKLNSNKGILISSNDNPVLFDKIKYYKDKNFKNRIKNPPIIEPLPHKIYDIPKFDTEELNEIKPEIDPNQTSIFETSNNPETDTEFEIRINTLTDGTATPKAA